MGEPRQGPPAAPFCNPEAPCSAFWRDAAPHVGIVHQVRDIKVIEKPVTGDLPINQQIKREEKEGHNGFKSAGEDRLFLVVAFGIRISAHHWRPSKKNHLKDGPGVDHFDGIDQMLQPLLQVRVIVGSDKAISNSDKTLLQDGKNI